MDCLRTQGVQEEVEASPFEIDSRIRTAGGRGSRATTARDDTNGTLRAPGVAVSSRVQQLLVNRTVTNS